jgi:tRNA threonylcarbamoyladenosine biosynthesis protein TsaB
MIILTVKTNVPESVIALFSDDTKLSDIMWQSHRLLADTIHTKIYELLSSNKLDLKDIEGIVCYKGPGSFTGLRIGLTVANSLSQALKLPIVTTQSHDWEKQGINRIKNNEDDKIALPFYGSDAKTTKPKK